MLVAIFLFVGCIQERSEQALQADVEYLLSREAIR